MGAALVLSFASTFALWRAWSTAYFYWVWAGGVGVRLAVFALAFFLLTRFAPGVLVSAMITAVLATTLFLVVEAAAIFPKK